MELGCVGKTPVGVISPAFRCRLPPLAVVLLLAEDIGGLITLTVYKIRAHNLFTYHLFNMWHISLVKVMPISVIISNLCICIFSHIIAQHFNFLINLAKLISHVYSITFLNIVHFSVVLFCRFFKWPFSIFWNYMYLYQNNANMNFILKF